MILDYNFNKKKGQLTFSYITPQGGKKLLVYNVSRFKTFFETPKGKYQNWNGAPCDITYTETPGWTEIRTFIEELPEYDKKLLLDKKNPRAYAFDIEVEVDPAEFPEPGQAKFPILTISVVNDKLDAIVMGTKKLDQINSVQQQYEDWLNKCDFWKHLGLSKPVFKYLYFESEHDMLVYFLANFVAKCPVMYGWNSLAFDWQYIQNRIKNYYPDISFNRCSIDWTMSPKRIKDFRDENITLRMPNHTLVLDLMDIIGTYDMAVMPIKESLALDYIASESIGVGKIKYKGNLQQLYENDYATYVFYNLIDSVLCQLIDKRFKTLDVLYVQSLICRSRISTAFSKIAITEAMFFNYFFENGIKVVPTDKFSGERPQLVGAYVRQTTAGKHMYVACCDFASLYPSVIITCNISIENYLGSLRDGTFTEDDLVKYRQDPNYFVSVNGSVYKNDKDYAFKNIQRNLKSLRGQAKYLAKKLDATVMSDIDHLIAGKLVKSEPYSAEICEAMLDLGFELKSWQDIKKYDINELKRVLSAEVNFLICKELAIKLVMNSQYGGSSHKNFSWFCIDLANDITGEGRNLIHIMEHDIPKWFQMNWLNAKDLHERLGIKIKNEFQKC